MSTTYLPNTNLGYPAAGDTSYPATIQVDMTFLDGANALGDLCVATNEVPSASLIVKVAGGQIVDQSGTVQTIAGTTKTMTASSTQVVYLDGTASWAVTVASGYPTTPHIRLATVVSGSASNTSIADNRQCFKVSGQNIPVVTHLLSTAASAPTIAAGSAAGSSPTVSVAGTDVAGTVSITTGTGPATGVLATVTFNVAFASAPRAVQLTPANAATAAAVADWYAAPGGLTTTAFTLNAGSALSASTAYEWFYAVIG